MTWEANRIYSKPKPELIDYLKTIDGFKDELFLVDNFEGIRFDWARSFMLSDKPNKYSYLKHVFGFSCYIKEPLIGKCIT